jgi:hypothetical protein
LKAYIVFLTFHRNEGQISLYRYIFLVRLPEPLGRKSFPTTLSSTEDLPELCTISRKNFLNTSIFIKFRVGVTLQKNESIYTFILSPLWRGVRVEQEKHKTYSLGI